MARSTDTGHRLTRITKVYTRTGDQGQTSLANGDRAWKDSPRVCAYGEVDELNSLLGLVRTKIVGTEIQQLLEQVQNDLFVLGADLATPDAAPAAAASIRRISKAEVEMIEKQIDHYNQTLPALKEFILPAGNETGALLHVARAVARRAERCIVSLSRAEKVNDQAVIYLNRVSDLLFVLARVANRHGGSSEVYAQFH
ncbi:MAG: cob(I)yrinic acid a,c-diamide adenosyltransferase [Acidobacteria bacterium]|nr:cob(I)yrinic acid a,c-diamide adenosyltransferase [Acidobacteriota bacterium]